MAKETWGPFDKAVTIQAGEGKNARGEFGIPAGKILSFDADGKRVFSDPKPEPEKKAPAKKKAPTKKK